MKWRMFEGKPSASLFLWGDKMAEYKYRYPESRQKQDAYENACDCITAGIPMKDWNDCGLEFEQLLSVWNRAVKDVGKISMV